MPDEEWPLTMTLAEAKHHLQRNTEFYGDSKTISLGPDGDAGYACAMAFSDELGRIKEEINFIADRMDGGLTLHGSEQSESGILRAIVEPDHA